MPAFGGAQVKIGSAETTGGQAPAAVPKASGAFAGSKISLGGTAAPKVPAVPVPEKAAAPIAMPKTDIAPVKTENLFSKLKDLFTPKFGGTLPGVEAKPEKPKSQKAMVFEVGAGMDEAGKVKAKEAVDKVIATGSSEDYDSNVIKLPGARWGFDLNNSEFFQQNPLLTSIIKGVVELPERGIRTLGEGTGLSKPIEGYGGHSLYGGTRAARPTLYQVPSYADASSKMAGDLVDEGYPVATAVILSSAIHAGEFAGNALMYQGILEKGATTVATAAERDAARTVAADFLGKPKTMAQAEKNFQKIQMEFHPDKIGDAGQKISSQANNAIKVLREGGLPTQSTIKQGMNSILNKPVSELFGGASNVPAGIAPTMPIKGYLEAQNKVHAARTTLIDETTKALQAHGDDVTRLALTENLGLDAITANKIVNDAKALSVMKNPQKAIQETLQLSAPKGMTQVEAPKAFSGAKIELNKTAEEKAVAEKVYKGIKENGGVTISTKGAEPTKGFAYAPDKTTEYSVPEVDFHANSQKHINDFIEKNKVLLSQPGNHIGGWVDNGRVYLDVSRVGEPSAKTIQEAQDAQQLGVFDLERFETISTGQLAEDGKGVYTPTDEATNVYDKYRGKVSGADKEGGPSGGEKVQLDEGGGGEATPKKPVVTEEVSPKASRVFQRLQEENPELLSGDLSYNEMNLKKDAEKAVELVAKDKNLAFQIGMGMEEAPAGQTATAVNIALSEKALEEGNHTLYAQLIKNRSLAQTRRGQEIVAEKGSVTDNSTSRYVKELIATRLEHLGKKYLSTGLDVSTKKGGISIRKKSNKTRATEVIAKEVDKVKKKIGSTKELDLAEAQKLLDSLMC